MKGLVMKLLQWAFGAPTEEITTGLETESDGVPVASPEPHTVMRVRLANGETWELPLAADPHGGIP